MPVSINASFITCKCNHHDAIIQVLPDETDYIIKKFDAEKDKRWHQHGFVKHGNSFKPTSSINKCLKHTAMLFAK